MMSRVLALSSLSCAAKMGALHAAASPPFRTSHTPSSRRSRPTAASSDDHQNARYARPPSGMPLGSVERLLLEQVPLALISEV